VAGGSQGDVRSRNSLTGRPGLTTHPGTGLVRERELRCGQQLPSHLPRWWWSGGCRPAGTVGVIKAAQPNSCWPQLFHQRFRLWPRAIRPSSSTTDQTAAAAPGAGSQPWDWPARPSQSWLLPRGSRPTSRRPPEPHFPAFKRGSATGHQRSAEVATRSGRPSCCHGSCPHPGPSRPASFSLPGCAISPQRRS